MPSMLQQNPLTPSSRTGSKQTLITPYSASWCTESGHCSLKNGSMIAGSGAHLPLETRPMQSFTASPSSGVPSFQLSTPVGLVEQACILIIAVKSSPLGDKYTGIIHRHPGQQRLYRDDSSSGSSRLEDPASLMIPSSYQEEKLIAASRDEALQNRNCLYFVGKKTGILLSYISRGKYIVNHYDWIERKAKERLLDCLQDKTLDFARDKVQLPGPSEENVKAIQY